MKVKHFVTALCPTYRRPRFVEQAVQLFLRQTWKNSELLILDDSPPAEQTTVRESSRIKVVRFSQRLSQGEKLNIGLDMAQGELVAHWDDDDWQSAHRLVRQVETLVLEPVDVCGYTCEMLLTTGDANFWRFDRTFRRDKTLVGNATIPLGIPFMDGAAAFRRSAVGPTRYTTIAVGQKVQFIHDLWKKQGAKLKALPNPGVYVYVRHSPRSGAENTWQYLQDRRLTPLPKPVWFPEHELDFYRQVGS